MIGITIEVSSAENCFILRPRFIPASFQVEVLLPKSVSIEAKTGYFWLTQVSVKLRIILMRWLEVC